MAKASSNQVDLLFRAFSDKTRLRILHLLTAGELCVCDLVALLDVPQPTASRHLAYLRRSGLVLTRKQGLWIYYRLAPAGGGVHRGLLKLLDQCENEMPELAKDAKRLKSPGKMNCC